MCLTVEPDSTLTVRGCSATARQKWHWEDDQLFNELGGWLSLENGKLVMSHQPGHYSDWRNFIRRTPADDALTVH